MRGRTRHICQLHYYAGPAARPRPQGICIFDSMTASRPRLIALYLPQFHPIPENDAWWGVGFTEWTNTANAKPLFRNHYQPHVPADLGFYDLRVPESREAQARLARDYGIEAFCYYHYWFAGRRIIERPFNEVLASGRPEFPFCLCWANQTWSGIWHGNPERVLIEQTYPGREDYRAHFEALPKWREIHLPFSDFKPHRLEEPLDLTRLRRIGVVAIGREFFADLCLGEIGFYN